MSIPEPPVSLDNSCSVIRDNTLYSYSSQGFLSLRLEEGAQWKKLEMGVKASGATCVGTTPGDASQAAFFVIGGTTDSADYTGLQKYTYSTGNWTTIKPSDLVTKNRQWHSSTYIQANNAILVYAGSQDGVQGPSSQTFTIQASEPYEARSFQSSATPAVSPIVMSWSAADAAMMSGDGSNGQVYLFNPAAGWRFSGASLAQPIQKNTGSTQTVLVNGDDGSKSLYIFDLAKSPNSAARVTLQNAAGDPVTNSAPVKRTFEGDGRSNQRRALTLDNWPNYNSTLAPTVTRKDFAVAQGSNGIVVFSGGNAQEPLSIFDANQNSWLNATDLLLDKTQTVKAVSSTSTGFSSTSTASFTSSTTISSTIQTTAATTSDSAATLAPAGGSAANDSGPSSNAILAITLGSISGFLLLLGLILLLLRLRKRRQNHTEAGHMRRDSGISPAEKDEAMGFAQSTLPPASPGHFRGHQHQMSQESYSSVAILMGRMNQKPALNRNLSNDSRNSVNSMHKQFKSTISKPILQVHDNPVLQGQDEKGVAFAPSVAEPRPRNGPLQGQDGTRRSSGWNRYWSGGSALQILGFGANKRNTAGSDQSSRYSGGPSNNPRATQDSATVPPLNFEGRPEVNSVNSGSPVVSQYHSKFALKEGIAGKIERPVSPASSGYSSGIPESVHDSWDPTGDGKSWGAERVPSSAYAPSVQYEAASARSSSGARPPPLGLSKQPQLAMAATSTDMSWLNLGDHSRV